MAWFLGECQCSLSSGYPTYPTTSYNSTDFSVAKSEVFRIGVPGSYATGFINIWLLLTAMADTINNSTDLLSDVRIELYGAEMNRQDANALVASQHLINNLGVRAFIGGVITTETEVMQLVCRISDVPQVTPLVISSTLSDKVTYPLLARVIPSAIIEAYAIAQFMHMRNWRQVLFTLSDEDSGTSGLQNFKEAALKYNITVYSVQVSVGQTNFTQTIQTIQTMVEQYRIRIFVHYMLITEAKGFFPALQAAGYEGPAKYVHIFGYNTAIYLRSYPAGYFTWGAGGLGVLPQGGAGPTYTNLLPWWDSLVNRTGWKQDLALSWYYYDALMTVVYSLDNLLKNGTSLSEINGTTHMEAIGKLQFVGVTGNVSFDSNLDREGYYNWFNFGTTTEQNQVPVGSYSYQEDTTTITGDIILYGNATTAVDGVCECYQGTCDDNDVCHCNSGYSGDTCSVYVSNSGGFPSKYIAVVVVLPVFFIVLICVGAVQYGRIKRNKAIKDVSDRQRSVIKREDLTLNNVLGRGASGVVHKAMFRGTEVAVKRVLATNTSKDAVTEFELETAIMAGLRHPNIVLFMGSCFVPEEKEMLLVMEFMEKGSLNDVLHNPTINFSFEMALHVATQAAKGMNFLHQSNPPIYHRDLKSHNILLDEKWNARISDFGISKIKELNNRNKAAADDAAKSMGTIFWTAPEVLEGKQITEKCDCYSFGIVLWELVSRQNPYDGREPMYVALEVCRNNLRPAVENSVNSEYKALMQDCWAPDPNARPSFQQIVERLRQLTMKYPMVNFTSETATSDAPSGMVYFVQTDVFEGDSLWDKAPNEMLQAIGLHNNLIRSNLKTYDGYEVHFKDNGFLVAFEDLENAVNWCVATQVALLHITWPAKLLSIPAAAEERDSTGRVVWKGLRVRMAVHSGVPESDTDPATGRTTYAGAVVDRVRKILHTAPKEVSIAASGAIVDQLTTKSARFSEPVRHKECGEITTARAGKLEPMYQLLPASLDGRLSSDLETSTPVTPLPHAVMLIDEDDITPGSASSGSGSVAYTKYNNEKASWILEYESLAMKENVGRGSVGDYFRGFWQGREVAIKHLLNQKLDEPDLLQLKLRVSMLSKLRHKNLIEIYGVCLEPGHFSIVKEFKPNSGLRGFLNRTPSTSLPTKIKIAKQIAEGMTFVSSLEHPALSIHTNLKSGNVLVNADISEVKLTDVGLGCLKDLARTMTSVGTVSWTAPEILNGEKPTQVASVYSFGIILYEIYTHKMPHPNEHPIKLVAKVLDGFRPTFPADCPPEYKQLAERCWHPDPASRPVWSDILYTLEKM